MKEHKDIIRENIELKARLAEAEELLAAIRAGSVDALVTDDQKVFTLQSADQAYRTLVEAMTEGAATLMLDGTVMYSNNRLAAMLNVPLEKVIGKSILDFVCPDDVPRFKAFLDDCRHQTGRAEFLFQISKEHLVPVQVSCRILSLEYESFCVVIMDLTKQKDLERSLMQHQKNLEGLVEARTKELSKSESRLRLAQESAHVGIWDWDVVSGAVEYTPELNKLYGFLSGTIRSYQNLRERVHPDDVDWIESQRDAAIARHESFDLEFRARHASGEFIWIASKGGAFYNEAGEVRRVLAVNIDITARKRMEAASSYLKAIVDSADDAIIGEDLDGNIISWNAGAERMFGYAAGDMVGASIRRLIPADRQEEETSILNKLRHGEAPGHVETMRQKKDGSLIAVAVTASPIRDMRGRMIGVSKVIRDISERKKMEKELLETVAAKASAETARQKMAEIIAVHEELKKTQDMLIQAAKMAAVGTLSAGVSHELNNPLTVILSIARDHVEHDASDAGSGDYKNIVTAGERMARIIKGLLEFSRSSEGEMQDWSCNDLINDVFVFARKTMMGSGVDVRMDFDKDLPLVRVDKNKVEQVFIIIMGNAVDAMEKKGLLEIDTRGIVVEGKRFVEVGFTDSGGGIKKDDITSVFDPFFTTKRPGKGTGLGLSVAHSIIKEYHGEIRVESPPAGRTHGTSFKVRLPAVALHSSEVPLQ